MLAETQVIVLGLCGPSGWGAHAHLKDRRPLTAQPRGRVIPISLPVLSTEPFSYHTCNSGCQPS